MELKSLPMRFVANGAAIFTNEGVEMRFFKRWRQNKKREENSL
jgi:hypothetical protein